MGWGVWKKIKQGISKAVNWVKDKVAKPVYNKVIKPVANTVGKVLKPAASIAAPIVSVINPAAGNLIKKIGG